MRGVLLGLGWLLLCAAGPLPAIDPPARVPLGSALTLRYRLPATDLRLPGLPPLAGLQQLQPPQQHGGLLTWRLLAVRPGPQTVPALVLEDSHNRRWETADTPITVTTPPLAAGARPAGLKPIPEEAASPRQPVRLWWWLLPLPLLAWSVRRSWRRRQPAKSRDQRLARLAALLADQPPGAPGEVVALRRLLEQLRFAPGGSETADLDRLEARIRSLVTDGGRGR